MTALQHDPDLARADHLLTAEELRKKYGHCGNGGEHPRFRRFEWKQEVASDSTLRSYWDYVAAKIEQAHDEEG